MNSYNLIVNGMSVENINMINGGKKILKRKKQKLVVPVSSNQLDEKKKAQDEKNIKELVIDNGIDELVFNKNIRELSSDEEVEYGSCDEKEDLLNKWWKREV